MTAEEIIRQFNLQEHPEGGYFKETYRSKGIIPNSILDSSFEGDRNICTGIYFLLTSEKFSAFHKVNQDEMWHFYKGAPLKLHMISTKGEYSFVIIGNNLKKGQIPQFTVNGGDWFAAEVIDQNSFSFVGCTVAPGFDFKDFELPTAERLISQFPQHTEIINSLTY